MKEKNNASIKRYSTTAAALLGAAGAQAQAQFEYTDVDDTTVVNGVYALDLNNDTIVDFTIEHILGGGQNGNVNAILIHPGDSMEGNLAIGMSFNGFNYTEKVLPNTTIDGDSEWNGIGGNFDVGYMAFEVDGVAYPNSNWAGPVTDGYLGLRLVVDDTAHFGWARIDVEDSTKSFTLKDFSFNPTPDSAHVAGFELLDIAETVFANVKAWSTDHMLNVELPGKAFDVAVYASNGQLIAEGSGDGVWNTASHQWATGVYTVKINHGGWSKTVKIWVP